MKNYVKVFVCEDKNVHYFSINGQLHRTDGPAIEYANGGKEWFVNGNRHREDGPAIEWADGHKEWWLIGKQIREDELYCAESENQFPIFDIKIGTKAHFVADYDIEDCSWYVNLINDDVIVFKSQSKTIRNAIQDILDQVLKLATMIKFADVSKVEQKISELTGAKR